jgi:hypothetical protein
LLFGVLGWVSVQHFDKSADVRRATFDLILNENSMRKSVGQLSRRVCSS